MHHMLVELVALLVSERATAHRQVVKLTAVVQVLGHLHAETKGRVEVLVIGALDDVVHAIGQ